MNTSSKEYVFRKFDELKAAIRWDTFNLPRDTQSMIENKIQELQNTLKHGYDNAEQNN